MAKRDAIAWRIEELGLADRLEILADCVPYLGGDPSIDDDVSDLLLKAAGQLRLGAEYRDAWGEMFKEVDGAALELPAAGPVVYYIWSSVHIQYVGVTKNLVVRLGQHASSYARGEPSPWKAGVHVTWRECDGLEEARRLEWEEIGRLSPPHNIHGRGGLGYHQGDSGGIGKP
jgi:hypothetical protein